MSSRVENSASIDWSVHNNQDSTPKAKKHDPLQRVVEILEKPSNINVKKIFEKARAESQDPFNDSCDDKGTKKFV